MANPNAFTERLRGATRQTRQRNDDGDADSVADAGADEDMERADGGEVATPMPPPGARRQDFSSTMRAEFNPEVTTPFGDDERQQHTTPTRAMVKGVQLQVFRAMETKTFDFEMQDKLAAARAKLDLLRRKREFLAARGIRHPLNRHGASDAEAFRKLFSNLSNLRHKSAGRMNRQQS